MKSPVTRAGRLVFGGVLLLAGLALMILPGPGTAVLVAALLVLESEVPWARRARQKLFGAIVTIKSSVVSFRHDPTRAERRP